MPRAQKTRKTDTRRKRRWWRHKDVNAGAESFASGLNVYKIIWVFILGCFIGVAFETLYVYFREGVWMRRSGMLYGPFNQIYGMGAVLFTVLLYRFRKKNAFLIFLASAVIGGVFEYVASWVQQLAFGSVSWDYSDMSANIGGRTNLFYAAGWGVMGLLFITHFWPFLSELIERIPNAVRIENAAEKSPNKAVVITGRGFTIAFAAFLAVDLALSGLAVFRAGERARGLPPANAIENWADTMWPDDVMAEKYPSLEFVGRLSGEPVEKAESGASASAGGTIHESSAVASSSGT